MKRIIFLFAMCFSFLQGFNQIAPTRSQLLLDNATGSNRKSGAFRVILYLPNDTLSTLDSGAVAFKGGKLWLKDTCCWKQVLSTGSIGEANVGKNVGDGVGIYKQKNGDTLEFFTLVGGANMQVVRFNDTIVIAPTFGPADGTETKLISGTNTFVEGDGSIIDPYKVHVPFFVEDLLISNDSLYYFLGGIKFLAGVFSGGGGGTWGSITGTLSDQTDLQTELNLKLNSSDTANHWLNDIRRRSGTDSVEVFKNGAWQFKYKDSTGTVFTLYNALGGTGDTLVNADKEVKTLEADWGLLHEITGSTIKQKGDSTKIATKYDLACNWPRQTVIGKIYDKTYWYNLSDFTTHGTITAEVNAGDVLLSGGTGTYTDYISVGSKTVLENWHMRAQFKLLNAGSNYGVAIGTKYQNGAGQGDIVARLTTGAVTGNQMYLARSNSGTSLATGTGGYTMALNNQFVLDLVYDGNHTLTFTYTNLTTSETDVITYTYPNAGDFPPMLGLFSIYEFSGEHALQSLLIEFNEVRNPNLSIVGDSKAQGFTTSSFANRFGKLLESNYGPTVINAGGGDLSLHLAERLNDIYLVNPRQIINEIGSNDIRAGRSVVSTIATIDSIDQLLTSRGIQVYYVVFPEDSTAGGVGLTAFKNALAAKYGYRYISQVWDSLQTSNKLKAAYNPGDGIHVNTAGNLVIKNAIVASGKLTNCNGTFDKQLKNSDNKIRVFGDSVFIDPEYVKYIDSIAAVAGTGGGGAGGTVGGTGTADYVTKWSSSTDITNSQIRDNGTAVGINQAPNNTYRLGVTGLIGTSGTDGGLMLIDRTPGRNGWGLLAENNILRFYNASLGDTPTLLDSLGRFSSTKILANTTSDNGIGALQVNGKVTIATADSTAAYTGAFAYFAANGELKKSLVPGSTPGITGSGTAGRVAVFTSSSAIGDGLMTDNGTSIAVNGGSQSDFSNAAFKVFAGSTKEAYIGYNGGVSPNYAFIGAATVGTSHDNFVINKDGGNLGIANVNPQAILHVTGSVRFDLGSDATGDIFYRGSGGNLVRLPIGSNGDVLTLASGLPSWAGPASATTIYNGDGTISSTRTLTGGNNTVTLTGTQSSLSAFNVTNTGNGGAGSFSASGTGTALTGANSSSGNGVLATSSSGNGIRATSVSGSAALFKITPSSTNTIVHPIRIIRGSSGTMAAGAGGGIEFAQTDDAGNDVVGATIAPVYTSAATGATSTDLQFTTTSGGSNTLKGTLKAAGQFRLHAYTGSMTGTAATNAQFTSDGSIIQTPFTSSFAGPIMDVLTADPDNLTAAVSTFTILPSLAGAGGSKTVTLPSAASNTGKIIILHNVNADANVWSFAAAITLANGTTTTTFANGTLKTLFSNGSVWIQISSQ